MCIKRGEIVIEVASVSSVGGGGGDGGGGDGVSLQLAINIANNTVKSNFELFINIKF
jgi:hypothetical protein